MNIESIKEEAIKEGFARTIEYKLTIIERELKGLCDGNAASNLDKITAAGLDIGILAAELKKLYHVG